jgi:hypothetical protein
MSVEEKPHTSHSELPRVSGLVHDQLGAGVTGGSGSVELPEQAAIVTATRSAIMHRREHRLTAGLLVTHGWAKIERMIERGKPVKYSKL